MVKADGAFLTIGELAEELGVAQHILRYWETRFPQLRPLQRSGNRRYYRPGDVETARRINRLLNEQGFTVRGAKRVLEGKAETDEPAVAPATALVAVKAPEPAAVAPVRSAQTELALGDDRQARRAQGQFDSSDIALLIARLTVIRENLKEAIDAV
jgi:DNA-binding transcriptional MerR regulator